MKHSLNRIYALEYPVSTAWILIHRDGSVSRKMVNGDTGGTLRWHQITRRQAATMIRDAHNSVGNHVFRQFTNGR